MHLSVAVILVLILCFIPENTAVRGKCPDTGGYIGICVFTKYNCLSDRECRYGEKCCSAGCGRKCMRISGKIPSIDRCKQPKDAGRCRALKPRWYYNYKSGQCERFTYGGCRGNGNRFTSSVECEKACGNNSGICKLPKQPGLCKAYIPSWYYNYKTGQCEEFVYGGCRGNRNRFSSRLECSKSCGGKPPVPTPVCRLPKVRGPCKAIFRRWYYNYKTGKCERFIYSGCRGNKNRFTSFRSCQRKCSRKPGGSICRLPRVTGPCRARIPSWYYNHRVGRCMLFFYGGCQGNRNRFPSQRTCARRCGGRIGLPKLAVTTQ